MPSVHEALRYAFPDFPLYRLKTTSLNKAALPSILGLLLSTFLRRASKTDSSTSEAAAEFWSFPPNPKTTVRIRVHILIEATVDEMSLDARFQSRTNQKWSQSDNKLCRKSRHVALSDIEILAVGCSRQVLAKKTSECDSRRHRSVPTPGRRRFRELSDCGATYGRVGGICHAHLCCNATTRIATGNGATLLRRHSVEIEEPETRTG